MRAWRHPGGGRSGLDILQGAGGSSPTSPPRLPESSGAEGPCHHVFSSSAKLCLGEARDASPEVFTLSHTYRGSCVLPGAILHRQLLSLRPCSRSACLVVWAWGRVNNAMQPSLLGVTQALALGEHRNLAQERTLSKQWQQPFHHTQGETLPS